MAEVLYNKRSAEGHAKSCGLSALDGMPASSGAILAVQSRGCSLEEHRSRRVRVEMVQEADEVWCMSESHAVRLAALYPDFAQKIRALSPAISDPFGGDEEVYEKTCRLIEDALSNLKGYMPDAR